MTPYGKDLSRRYECSGAIRAIAANKMRIPLAKMAVAETGMGVVEDKVIKNHYAAEYIYNAYKDTTPFLFPTKESIRRCFNGKKAK